ncbi:unnamed protein product [Lepeophtheirus salmonis]|uniref:(salmon louse) hypothetical protein n=1 Tax=Lepeophtheirus salmonis TaxID=72036 RepID=A0A7R8CY36_LEPSM|nr:unnamed protein product [Lepeophtheirus salmonis]CAF2966969.1 unnamed protein product [Lepeophtheirus salmonis]
MNDASKKISLNTKKKSDTFVITLTETNTQRVFININMKYITDYNAALRVGFSKEEIAVAKVRYGYTYASLYTSEPANIQSCLANLKNEYSTEVEGPRGEPKTITMKSEGIENLDLDHRRKRKIKADNTFKRVDEEKIEKLV